MTTPIAPYAGHMTFTNPWGAVYAIIVRKDANGVKKQQVANLTPFITSLQVKLREDGGHSWTMQVVNPRGSVLPLLRPRDMVIIMGGRHQAEGLQILTGYVDKVPWDTEFKGDPLTISGFCTLYRAMTRYFDPYLTQFQGVPSSTPDQILRLIATDPQLGGYEDTDVIIEPLDKIVKDRWLASIQTRINNSQTANPTTGSNVSVPGGASLAFVQDTSIKVKHTTATVDQKTNMAVIMSVGISLGASDTVLQAALMAGTQESSFDNNAVSHDGAGSLGIFQITAAHHTPDNQRKDPDYNAHQFFSVGFTGVGGAIKIAHDHPEYTPGQIAQAVEGSAYPTAYNAWGQESSQSLAKFKGYVQAAGGVQSSIGQQTQQDQVNGAQSGRTDTFGTSAATIANGEIGNFESPPGSNKQKYGEFWNENGQPWCALFVMYCWKKAGAPIEEATAHRLGYVPTLHGDATSTTNDLKVPTDPAVGDAAIFGSDEHVELVVAVNGNSIQTIGGNTSASDGTNPHQGQVALKTHDKGSITAFVRYTGVTRQVDLGTIGNDMSQSELRQVYTIDEFEKGAYRVKYERMDDIVVLDYMRKVTNWGFYKMQTDGLGRLHAYVPRYLLKKPTYVLSEMDIEHYVPMPWSLNDLKTHVYVKGQFDVFTPSTIADWRLLIGASTIYDPINYPLLMSEPLFSDFKAELRQRIDEKLNKNNTTADWISEQQQIDPTGAVTLVIDKIIAQFGARPLLPFIEEPYLRTFEQIQLEADFKFQEAWFNRYRATVTATFQPSLRPGDTTYLPSQGRMFYAEEVTHTMFSAWTTEVNLKAGRAYSKDINDIKLMAPVRTQLG